MAILKVAPLDQNGMTHACDLQDGHAPSVVWILFGPVL